MSEWFDRAVADLVERGWFAAPDFFEPDLVDGLADEARALWVRGDFRAAGVGRGDDWHVEPDRRGDSLLWLDPACPTPPQARFWERMEVFRQRLNRELYLSIRELELQYAVYPKGQRYERHIDQFEGVRARVITVLLYLNRGWRPEDGGQLRIWPDRTAAEPAADVLPAHNTFVCFRSELVPHEVLAPRRERFSLGGWFRIRSEIPLAGATPRRP